MIFYYLAKCIYSFDRTLFNVTNCADRLFEYFEILLLLDVHMECPEGKKQHF